MVCCKMITLCNRPLFLYAAAGLDFKICPMHFMKAHECIRAQMLAFFDTNPAIWSHILLPLEFDLRDQL